MSQQDIDTVRSLYAAFQRGDTRYILDRLAEDVDWGIDSEAAVPWFGLRRGREGARDFFQSLAREVEFTHFEPQTYAAADGRVYCSLQVHGKLKNGEEFGGTEVHIFTLRGGQVLAWHGYVDTAGIQAAYEGKPMGKGTPSGVAMSGRPRI